LVLVLRQAQDTKTHQVLVVEDQILFFQQLLHWVVALEVVGIMVPEIQDNQVVQVVVEQTDILVVVQHKELVEVEQDTEIPAVTE
jgi:hypothetical protein